MAARESTVIRAGEGAGVVGGGGDRGYVDWGAIFAGGAIAVGTSVVLTTFAAGLGLGAISADPDDGLISGWGVALTGLFTVIAMVAAYMLGGYIAGRMRRPVGGSAGDDERTARDGIHGLVVWALGMILGGILAMGAVTGTARAVGGAASTAVEAAGSAVGGIAQGAGQLAGQAVAPAIEQAQATPGNPLDYITDRMLRQTPAPAAAPPQGATDPGALRAEVTAILGNALVTGEMTEADQAYLRDVIAARTGLPPAEVEARAAEAVQSAQQMRAEAQQTAQEIADQAIEAAETARQAAILSAFLLAAAALVAAVAAYIGAVKGGRHRDEGRIWGGLRYHR